MNFELGEDQAAIVEAVGALLTRHAGAARAWDRVAVRRLLLEPGVRPRFARFHVGQIGD
jgi:hypothetical protein